MMKVAVLIDNKPHHSVDFLTEHGLSIYFEADGYKCLLDVGASDKFAHNAINMGIDVADIDYLILSHGHNDHTGGLETFLKLNSKAKVFLSAHVEGKTFFSTRRNRKRDISMDFNIVKQHLSRFEFVNKKTKVTENVTLISKISKSFDEPKANTHLLVADEKGERKDSFEHEVAVSVNTPKGMVVFSGCSHSGILNMLAACSENNPSLKIKACIGGAHLIDSDIDHPYETKTEVEKIANSIKNTYTDMYFVSGHCTGINAQQVFSDTMGSKFNTFYSGMFLKI